MRELLSSVEVDETEPLLETPDIFEPDPRDELQEDELQAYELREDEPPVNERAPDEPAEAEPAEAGPEAAGPEAAEAAETQLPEAEEELELAPQAPRRMHSPLARALAVAVDVEAACEASKNSEAQVLSRSAPAQSLAGSPTRARPLQLGPEAEEEPPFDAPDEDDDIFRPPPHARRWSDPADVLELHMPAPPSFPHEPTEIRPPPRPAPAISIHVHWDRSAGAELAAKLASEPLLARADVSDARGGIAGAAAHLAKSNAPDLLILETTLKAGPLLEAIDALQGALAPATRLFIVGDVNDVTLLRDLARRGIIHYFLAPACPAELARAICDLHAEVDKSRVVAVVGSRGGVGASTIAHNLAWSLAERTDASTTLIELDVAFGATAFSFDQRPGHSLAEGVRDPQSINEAFLDRVGAMQTERLRLISAPASLSDMVALERPVVGALIRSARRMSKVVVLDVPHHWDACIKDVLERANDVLIVASPDLASLRNTKNLLDVLKGLRPGGHEPSILLSMMGASKGSEISEKDFAGAIGAKPLMAFDFDPALVAGSALKRQMLGEAAPQSPIARQIDDLAVLLTGRSIVKRRKRSQKCQAQQDAPLLLETGLDQAPVSARIYSAREAAPEHQVERPVEHPVEHPVEQAVEQAIEHLTEQIACDRILELMHAPEAAPGPPEPSRRRPRPLSRRQVTPKPFRKRAPAQPGTLRLTAALMALLAASMWYVEKRTDLSFIGYAISSPR